MRGGIPGETKGGGEKEEGLEEGEARRDGGREGEEKRQGEIGTE